MRIPKKMCKECRNLPEGEVVAEHDHRIPTEWQLQAAIYILAESIQDGRVNGITESIDKYLGEFADLNNIY